MSTMHRRLLTAALVAIVSAFVPGSGRAASSIPFTTDGGMVQVAASLDGGAPVPMLVDLGAGVDVLTTKAAQRVHLVTDDAFTAWRMRGERTDLRIGAVGSIALGPLRVEKPWVTAWSGLDGHGIDGLISAVQFRNAPVTFDYAHDVLTFEDQTSLAARTAAATKVPLLLQDDRGISLALFARFDFGRGQSGLCEIDTGSQGFFLDRRFAAKLGFDAKATRGRIGFIALQGAPRTAISRPVVGFENLIYDCNVGNDFWAGRSFTLDIPQRALYV